MMYGDNKKNKRLVYLDYAAATPVDTEVAKRIHAYDSRYFANPSAIHASGVEGAKVIDESRAQIAELIHAHSDEIFFTGSGTESDAIAMLGVVYAYTGKEKPHIITSAIEHSAVIENCNMLEARGMAEVTYLPIDEKGIVDIKELKQSLKANTILVSIMYANNEIGTIQPIEECAKAIRHFKKEKKEKGTMYPIFHTDAAQAMNYLFTENIEKLGVDLLSFNGSKIYGPKGVGVLYKKRHINLAPIYRGGGQEQDLRSGTENLSGIAGVALALEITHKMKAKESARLARLRDYAITRITDLSRVSGYNIILNGDLIRRLPNNINISISGLSSELLVIELSSYGVMVSEKSACKSDEPDESYVITALHKASARQDRAEAVHATSGSLRISLGRATKKEDVIFLVASLKKILAKYKAFR